MKYLFGPVNSRRLGLSLGIDLVPVKICNYDCIYCEVGATSNLTCERKEYNPTQEILAEIDLMLADEERAALIDVFTVTGTGEPTLHSDIGKVIRYIKERTSKPVAVLTNGSLFHLPEVRQALMAADIVIPSMDSARMASFRKVNRPALCADLEASIDGIARFCREFDGQVWLEVLLVSGFNDSDEDIVALKDAIKIIKPERIQLNTVVRPPLESFAVPETRARMEEIAAELGRDFDGKVEILVDFSRRIHEKFMPIVESEIIDMLKRRPCTASDICEALNLDQEGTDEVLAHLVKDGAIHIELHEGKQYFQVGAA
jgi:wyosine [tRNA(Phe)-imidazoG37] synthetase (radical SAM superfamily)